jgi:hypothetical protein
MKRLGDLIDGMTEDNMNLTGPIFTGQEMKEG